MSDEAERQLVERLRIYGRIRGDGEVCLQAATEIERMTAEIARLNKFVESMRCPNCDKVRLQFMEAESQVRQLQEALAAWRNWFARTGDGSMANKTNAEYQQMLIDWLRDGAALQAANKEQP